MVDNIQGDIKIMEPKNMTLGELVCEFVEAYIEYRFPAHTSKHLEVIPEWVRMNDIRTELILQLNTLEINNKYNQSQSRIQRKLSKSTNI